MGKTVVPRERAMESDGTSCNTFQTAKYLMTLDDPEKYVPPEGPVITPPKHIENIIRNRQGKLKPDVLVTTDASVKTSRRSIKKVKEAVSDFNIRKDFFKVNEPKNLHHAQSEAGDFCRTYKYERRTGKSQTFLQNHEKGWFVVKQAYSPAFFETMTELIAPIENYEFLTAFEVFLSFLHNSKTVMHVDPKEDAIEIWSRGFAKKLQEVGRNRPSTFHTVVIPLILKPITKNSAWNIVTEEWRKRCAANCIPAESLYSRCINRWILPLTEPVIETEDGVYKKPEVHQVHLDLGYLFGQRRLHGLRALARCSTELGDRKVTTDVYYQVMHRVNPGRRLSGYKKLLNPAASHISVKVQNSSTNLQSGVSGNLRVSGLPNQEQLTMTLKKQQKFEIDRLLIANRRKKPFERMYWLHAMRRHRQQPPKTFAKFSQVDQNDSPNQLTETRNEFLEMYFPLAHREQYKEPRKDPSILYPQFDMKVIRGMVHDEIKVAFSEGEAKVKRIEKKTMEHREPMLKKMKIIEDEILTMENSLNAAKAEVRISVVGKHPLDLVLNNAENRRQYLSVLDEEAVLIEEPHSTEASSEQKTAKELQIIGSDVLDVLKRCPAGLIAAEDPSGEPFIGIHVPNQTTADEAFPHADAGVVPNKSVSLPSMMVPRSDVPADSLVTMPLSVQKSAKDAEVFRLSTRQVLLDLEEDPSEEHSLFLRLVIDSGHNYFYFDFDDYSDEEYHKTPSADVKPFMEEERRAGEPLATVEEEAEQSEHIDGHEIAKLSVMFDRFRSKHPQRVEPANETTGATNMEDAGQPVDGLSGSQENIEKTTLITDVVQKVSGHVIDGRREKKADSWAETLEHVALERIESWAETYHDTKLEHHFVRPVKVKQVDDDDEPDRREEMTVVSEATNDDRRPIENQPSVSASAPKLTSAPTLIS